MRIRNLLYTIFILCQGLNGYSQNIGIGTAATTRAKLEVWRGPASVSGIFGTTQGISIQNTPPAIGFNTYGGKYMGNGYAADIMFDPSLAHGMRFNFYSSGTANALLSSANTVMKLLTPTGSKILYSGAASSHSLDVGRGTGVNGTAQFSGTNYSSHFNFSTNEDTYIRGGKPGGKVYLNDVLNGDVIMGSGTSIIGINYFNPVYTFEVRQVSGTGIQMGNNPSYNWQWRVSGSPGNFYLRYAGATKCYFNPTNGNIQVVSDSRLKSDIQELGPVLEKIVQLNPVSYAMKDQNPGNRRSIGLIAQEVHELVPWLAQSHFSEKYMSINYSVLGVAAVAGVQEEQTLIDQVENKINAAEKIAKWLEQKLISKKNIEK